MEIIIPLPQNSSVVSYQEIRAYLKQLELAVHHAQKAVESAQKEGVEAGENSFVSFEHPSLEFSLKRTKAENILSVQDHLENFTDNYSEELQDIELKINLS